MSKNTQYTLLIEQDFNDDENTSDDTVLGVFAGKMSTEDIKRLAEGYARSNDLNVPVEVRFDSEGTRYVELYAGKDEDSWLSLVFKVDTLLENAEEWLANNVDPDNDPHDETD